MRKYGILLIICIFQILLSCTKVPVGPSLKDILSANSKLQVVLDKYKDDSLKYKSAVFLIENLPFHYSYEGEPLDDYLKLLSFTAKAPCIRIKCWIPLNVLVALFIWTN